MNQVQVTGQNQVAQFFSPEQIQVLKNTIAKEANNDELKLFMWHCERTRLDPFSRQIYFMKNKGKMTIMTSIDGFRLIAERSGKYDGQTPAQWCGQDGVWKDIWLSKDRPAAARVGVYKKGLSQPLYAVAHWDEYYKDAGYMPNKMPAHMLAKVAESLALRKAFPDSMSGIYTEEEMVKEPMGQKTREEIMEENGLQEPLDYRIPFGYGVGRSLDEAYRAIGPEKLMRSVELTEEKLAERVIYKGSSVQQMREYVDVMTKFLASKENGTDDLENAETEPSEGEFADFKPGKVIKPREDL